MIHGFLLWILILIGSIAGVILVGELFDWWINRTMTRWG